MPSINDLKRTWLLRMLGLLSSNLSEADLQAQLLADVSYSAGVRRIALPVIRSGQYFFPTSQNSSSTSAAPVNNTLRLYPWMLSRTLRITRLGAEVTAVGEAGSKLRLGVYADTGTGLPGALVVDAGQINGDSATVQELVTDFTIDAGVYWIGGVVQSAPVTQPTLRICGSSGLDAEISIQNAAQPAANALYYGYVQAGVAGALPETFAMSNLSTIAPVRLFAKAA